MNEWTQRRYVVLVMSLLLVGAILLRSDVSIETQSIMKGKSLESTYEVVAIGTKNGRNDPLKNKPIPNMSNGPSQAEKIAENKTMTKSSLVKQEEPKKPHVHPNTYPRAKELTQTATIVIQLSGELANNLQHIAHGIGLQQWARDEHGMDCNLVLRHYMGANNRAPKPKWKTARKDIQTCFPRLANWDFELGNSNVYKDAAKLQKLWLGDAKSDHLLHLMNSRNVTEIDRGMSFLKELLKDPNRPASTSNDIRIPHVVSNTLDVFPMIDRYYDQIRTIFEFNDTACCAILPSPNDAVFHFRNYISELPDWRAYDMGFLELSPNRTAHDLFANLQPERDHVRITTRIPNQKTRNYIKALQEIRGINASLVEDQSGVQDFCFLKRTPNQLVGSARSTYVLWAALLGNASLARLYHVDNAGLRNRHADFWERFTYNWTHPELRRRMRFEVYKSEEMDGFGSKK